MQATAPFRSEQWRSITQGRFKKLQQLGNISRNAPERLLKAMSLCVVFIEEIYAKQTQNKISA
jgi:hypothetical protein